MESFFLRCFLLPIGMHDEKRGSTRVSLSGAQLKASK